MTYQTNDKEGDVRFSKSKMTKPKKRKGFSKNTPSNFWRDILGKPSWGYIDDLQKENTKLKKEIDDLFFKFQKVRDDSNRFYNENKKLKKEIDKLLQDNFKLRIKLQQLKRRR